MNKNNIRTVLILGWLGILITVFYALVNRNISVFDYFVPGQGNNSYMDFMNHIKYAENPSATYSISHHACFPAFAYCIYFILGKFIPSEQITLFESSQTGSYALLLYLLYTVVLIVLFCNIVTYYLSTYTNKEIVLFELMCILSYPFAIGLIERGNSAFIVLLLLLYAFKYKDSDSKLSKETALILIAVAAAIKVYPAVFGLIYLSEKRYKEAIRLVIYGILFFFLPFMFFGGIEGFMQFLNNQQVIQENEYSLLSVANLIKLMLPEGNLTGVISYAIIGITGILLVVSYFKVEYDYVKMTLLVCACVVLPLWSGAYTVSYFIIPMLYYLKEREINNTQIGSIYEMIFKLSFALISTSILIPCFDVSSATILFVFVHIITASTIVFSLVDKQLGKTNKVKQLN